MSLFLRFSPLLGDLCDGVDLLPLLD